MKNPFYLLPFLIAFLLGNIALLPAQNATAQRAVVAHDFFEETAVTFAQPLRNPAPFIALSAVWYGKSDLVLQIRGSKDQRSWSDWHNCPLDAHANQTEDRKVGVLLFLDQNTQFVQYKIAGNAPERLEWHFFSPGELPEAEPVGDAESYFRGTPPEAQSGDPCVCPIPGFFTRAQWNCPDGDNPSCASPVYRPVTHLIVHHSAGSNSSNNWPAVVAAIWNFHVNTNGWCDIGYNWLIDPNGVLYEGRGGGNDVVGAHMCGYNSNTMGVCVLGNFMEAQPAEAALTTLQKLLAWKSCNSALDPLASAPKASYAGVMQVVSGHKDGCSPNATLCPGDNLYAKLPVLRPAVETAMKACASTAVNAVSASSVRLFPNPAAGFAEIRALNGAIQAVALSDLTGRTLRQIAGQNTETLRLDLSDLPAGIYIVGVRMKGGARDLFVKLATNAY
jgi:N-acetylmuramoyl-L-alanine amidase/Secretion system C-terminal sorting domain